MWPLAFGALIGETESDSLWSRIHARQALLFGIVGTGVFVAALALPLVAVLALPSLGTGGTIVAYTVGLVLDIAILLGFIVASAWFARRAASGELFTIPLITPLADRFMPVERDR